MVRTYWTMAAHQSCGWREGVSRDAVGGGGGAAEYAGVGQRLRRALGRRDETVGPEHLESSAGLRTSSRAAAVTRPTDGTFSFAS
jgi:hypothetical protein